MVYEYTNATIIGCKFINNTVTDKETIQKWGSTISPSFGAAIYACANSQVILKNNLFENNTASGYGGAIFFEQNVTSEILNCEFNNNKAKSGGAIYNLGNLLIDQNSKFNLNKASVGSAIYNDGSLTISDSEFLKNKADSDELKVFYDKVDKEIVVTYTTNNNYINAIQSDNTVNFENVRYGGYNTNTVAPVKSNRAPNQKITVKIFDEQENQLDTFELITDDNGVASKVYENVDLHYIVVIHDDDEFYGETSGSYEYTWGDFDELQLLILNTPENGVLVLDRDYTYTIGSDTITEGITIKKAITIDGNGYRIDALKKSRIFNILADNVNFYNIHFENATGLNGSFIHGINVNHIKIENCSFEIGYDQSLPGGGGIEFPVTPPIIDINIVQSDNVILGDGFIDRGGDAVIIPVDGGLEYPSYEYDTFSGGAIYIIGDDLSIVNSNFSNLNFAEFGGAVYFEGNELLIDNSTFENMGAIFGGALWLNATKVLIIDSQFILTNANAGGAIQAFGSDFKFINNLFASNEAYGEYQAHFPEYNPGTELRYGGNPYYITELSFINTEEYGGGAINLQANDVEITHAIFDYCYSGVGGAILATGKNLKIKDSNFTNLNYEDIFAGGAIFLDVEASGAVIENCTFENITYLLMGGGIVSFADDTTIKYSNFNNIFQFSQSSEMEMIGGAVAFLGNNDKIFSSNFTDNTGMVSGIAVISNLTIVSSGYDYKNDDKFGRNCLVDNCIFNNNIALSTIAWFGSNGIISNSSFNENIGIGSGAIFHSGFNLTVTDSNFTKNVAKDEGGVIVMQTRNSTVSNCQFESNEGILLGGAILIIDMSAYSADDESKSLSRVNNCTFINNSAMIAGALFAGGNVHIDESRFYNNTAFIGGAVVFTGFNKRILNSNFTDNSAFIGGAVVVNDLSIMELLDSKLSMTIESSQITGNSAIIGSNFNNNIAEFAPAILWSEDNGVVEKSIFDSNSFETYNQDQLWDLIDDVKIKSQVFNEIYHELIHDEVFGELYFDLNEARVNVAKNFKQASGSAIYWTGDNGFVNNSTFKNHNGTTFTYVDYERNMSLIFYNSMDNANYVSNKTYFNYLKDYYANEYEEYTKTTSNPISIEEWLINNVNGDEIQVYLYNETTGELTLTTVNFLCTSYTINGIIKYAAFPYNCGNNQNDDQDDPEESQDNPEETQDNPEGPQDNPYDDYYETPDDPDDYSWYYGDSNFKSAYKDWGQIYAIWSDYFPVEKRYPSYGGAIFWQGKNGLINGSIFINNTADEGGAVYVAENGEASCKSIENSKFFNNSALYSGGAIAIKGENVTVDKSVFNENYVIYVASKSGNELTAFANEHISSIGGGAINLAGAFGTISNSNFTNNTADIGGAIVIYGIYEEGVLISLSQNTTVTGCKFDENKAYYGGAIDWMSDDGDIISSVFTKNSADMGGAIYIEGGNVKVTSEFKNNTAFEGGALFLKGDESNIYGSYFESNYADKGGAVYVIGDSENLINSNFIKNEALKGGAIYWVGSGIVDGVKFLNNTAVQGGAVYYEKSALIIKNSEFRYNTAEIGSGLYISGVGVSIESSILLDNQAKALSLQSASEIVENTIIVKAIFSGNDNFINAIYTTADCDLNDVTYLGEGGIVTSDSSNPSITNFESGIDITLELYDSSFNPITIINMTNINGEAIMTVPNVKNGRYFVIVKHAEDTYYTELLNSEIIQVGLMDPLIDLNVQDIFYKENATVNVGVSGNATGNITFEIDGVNYTYENLTKSFATTNITGLSGGIHNLTVYYSGDETYMSGSAKTTFTVKPIAPTITIEANDGEYKSDIIVNVAMNSGVTGKVIVTIEDEFGHTFLLNGSVNNIQTIINTLNAGKYNISAYYAGNNNYTAAQNTTNFTVYPIDLNPIVSADNVGADENTTFTITVPNDFLGKVNITVGDISKVYDIAGPTQLSFVNLPIGNKTANVTFYNDNNYNIATVYPVNFAVSQITPSINNGSDDNAGGNYAIEVPSINAENMTRGYNSEFDYQAAFLDTNGTALVGKTIEFIINGKTYKVKTNEDGIAQLTESKLPVGKYDIIIRNTVTGEEVTRELKVVSRIGENKDLTMDYRDGSVFKVKVYGDDGKIAPAGEIIDITANGVHYVAKVDKNGYASLKITLLPKKYTITAEYRGFKTTNKLVVKQTLKVVKKTTAVKKGKKLVLKASLKWSNGKGIKGKKITFKLNGKTYSAKTNAKGIAKVTIKKKVTKKLKKGKKYTVKVTYAVKEKYGNAYQTISDTVKCFVKIKK